MSSQTTTSDNAVFDTSWIILLAISVLATLNHFMLPLYGDWIGLAIGFIGYSLYAIVVLAIPFHRGERWAWYSTWIQVIGFAALMLTGESVAVAYLVPAGVMAISLLITRPAFFRKETQTWGEERIPPKGFRSWLIKSNRRISSRAVSGCSS
jgi:hypothetical protein